MILGYRFIYTLHPLVLGAGWHLLHQRIINWSTKANVLFLISYIRNWNHEKGAKKYELRSLLLNSDNSDKKQQSSRIWIKTLWKFVLFSLSQFVIFFSFKIYKFLFLSKNFPFSLPPADHAIQIHGGKVLLHAQIQLKFEVNR